MGRKILFVTTDQQRFDTLACNGGLGVTPAGSKAMVMRMSGANLMVAGFVVTVGFFWPKVDQ